MSTPTLVWLSGETPDVDGHGGQRRQYAQVKALQQSGFRVHVHTAAGPQSQRSIAALVPVRRYRLRGWRAGAARPFVRAMVTLQATRGAAAVVISHLESIDHLSPMVLRALRKPVIFDVTDIYSEYFTDPTARARWRATEDRALSTATACIALSDEDAAHLRSRGVGEVVVWANGIDPSEWPRSAVAPAEVPIFYFFGSLAYDVNVQAVDWFLTEVFPTLRERLPDVRLRLSGPGTPPPGWAELDGVELLGWVPSVLEAATGCAGIIMPIHRGPGTRVKFSESLASGLPVITTAFAARGSQLAHRVVPAETPAEWVEACVAVAEGEYGELAATARREVLEIETWSGTGGSAMRLLERALAR